MPLLLTTPPVAEPVTLADAKAHLRISHTDDDAYLDKLISAARRAIESATGLRLITQGWSLFSDAWPPDGTLPIPLFPVASIDDVILFGEDDTPATLDPAHYVADLVSRPARLALRSGRPHPQPGRRLNGIDVRFTAGFGAASAVPQDIKQALLLAIAHWFDRRGEGAGGKLPMAALELLVPYRDVRLA